jgi:hypothetical protein
MSYSRAMFVGIGTLLLLFLPGYILIRENLDWSGWKTFFVCIGALIPWTLACIIFDSIMNIFRKESAFPSELIHAPLFVLYIGVPTILLYEWLGLKWLFVIFGGIVALFGLVAIFIIFFGEKLFGENDEEKNANTGSGANNQN